MEKIKHTYLVDICDEEKFEKMVEKPVPVLAEDTPKKQERFCSNRKMELKNWHILLSRKKSAVLKSYCDCLYCR